MPIIATGVIAAGSAIAGFIGASLLGGGKKEQTQQQAAAMGPIVTPSIAYPYAQYSPQYAPQLQWDYSYAPSIIIESPGAKGATIETKKEATSTPTLTPILTIQPTVSPTQTQKETATQQDLGLIPLVIIGTVVLGSVYLLTKKKKK